MKNQNVTIGGAGVGWECGSLAACAITAAMNRRAWGRWATARYLAKRGVPVRLYQIAVALEHGVG